MGQTTNQTYITFLDLYFPINTAALCEGIKCLFVSIHEIPFHNVTATENMRQSRNPYSINPELLTRKTVEQYAARLFLQSHRVSVLQHSNLPCRCRRTARQHRMAGETHKPW